MPVSKVLPCNTLVQIDLIGQADAYGREKVVPQSGAKVLPN